LHKYKDWIYQNRSILIIGVALIQGLLFVFLLPPWQHYDEPGHFEYAWLVANLDHWPRIGEYSIEMRREVAASMMEHNFYRDLPYLPNLLATEPPPDIGISQLGDLPIYYFLASIPLRICKFTDITFQLYLARLVSLILYIVTIWAAIGICRDLFGAYHPLTWMVPIFMVFLAPFTSLMTAVNNDVAAVASTTLFLWAAVNILLNDFHLRNSAYLILSLAICLLSKTTTLVTLPLFFFMVGVGIYRFFNKRVVIYVFGLLSIIAIPLLFSWNKSAPSLFYARQDKLLPTRIKSKIAPVGNYVFALPTQKSDDDGYYQMLPSTKMKQLSGRIITLGVWMWANKPLNIRSPNVIINNQGILPSNYIHLETNPNFYTFTGKVPKTVDLGWLKIFPGEATDGTMIYWDGWILTEGYYSSSPPPVFQDSQGSMALWDEHNIINILSNASGEKLWPVLRPPVSNFINSKLHFSSAYLWSFLDFSGTGWYFQTDLGWLFKTFWEKFAWGNVTLRGSRFFWVFSAMSFIGLIGSIIAGWKYHNQISWILVSFFGIAVLGTYWLTLLRGVGTWYTRLFLPAARYAYPAIMPVAIGLCGGWWYLINSSNRKYNFRKNIGFLVFLAGLAIYNFLSIFSILTFYRS
jgi:hypothetical protein